MLELPERQAKSEIEILIGGDTEASQVLRRCQTCNICEFTCHRNASLSDCTAGGGQSSREGKG